MLSGDIQQPAVLDHAGAVQHRVNAPMLLVQRLEQRRHGRLIAHIHHPVIDPRTQCRQINQIGLHLAIAQHGLNARRSICAGRGVCPAALHSSDELATRRDEHRRMPG